MADNYQQFALELVNLTPQEDAWLRKNISEEMCSLHISKSGRALLYAEECGNIDTLAVTLTKFLKKFRPKLALILSWADTCSSMRAGEFGGGAVAITASHQEWFIPCSTATRYLGESGYNTATLTKT